MQPSQAALRHVRDLARAALLIERGTAGPASASPDSARIAPEDVLSGVLRHRLVSLLAPHADDLGMGPDLVVALGELQARQRQRLLAQQLELAQLTGAVTAAGVRCMVFKGLPLAVQTTGDAGTRGPGDVDLLVPPEDLYAVHEALAGVGWHLRGDGDVTPGTWAWRHVVKTACALTYVGPGSNIDLHWRLDTTVDSLPPFDRLWDRREEVGIGGTTVATLSRRDAFAHSSFHAAKDRWRWLRSLVDLHRLAGMPEVWADPTHAPHRLEVASLAVTRASIGLPLGIPPAVLAKVERAPARTVEWALGGQEKPVTMHSATPGFESALNFRYLVKASSTPRDLRRSVGVMSLPVAVVAPVESRTAWTGVPVAFWLRLLRLRRRTSAWARHEQEATPDQVVRTP